MKEYIIVLMELTDSRMVEEAKPCVIQGVRPSSSSKEEVVFRLNEALFGFKQRALSVMLTDTMEEAILHYHD